jgi:hypothetical protein
VLEKDFNRDLRGLIRAQGLGAIHVVEADFDGVSDLIVYDGPLILGWLELKVDGEPLRPSQVEFLRDRDKATGNAFVVRMLSSSGIMSIERPRSDYDWSTNNKELVVLHRTALLGNFDWKAFLTKYRRTRK